MSDTSEILPLRSPMPAPAMTLPVLHRALITGCAVGVAVLAIDAVAPGRVAPLVPIIDPTAFLLVGGPPLPAGSAGPILVLSVAMNGAFYGLLSMIALVVMTLAGVRAAFERHHWLVLTTLMGAMMVVVRLALFHA